MSYQAGHDLCLGFWATVWDAGIVSFPPCAAVLEIGCAEADWIGPMLNERPDLNVTAIDWRVAKRCVPTIQGDVLTYEWPAASFDAIVAVSTLEHIGLGEYEQDPKDEVGDCKAVDRAVTWLKPGGWVYFDVPYRPEGPYTVTDKYRAYDEAALQTRLLRPGLRVRYRELHRASHPDGPYLSVVCDRV